LKYHSGDYENCLLLRFGAVGSYISEGAILYARGLIIKIIGEEQEGRSSSPNRE
jgi:hypothetical protein